MKTIMINQISTLFDLKISLEVQLQWLFFSHRPEGGSSEIISTIENLENPHKGEIYWMLHTKSFSSMMLVLREQAEVREDEHKEQHRAVSLNLSTDETAQTGDMLCIKSHVCKQREVLNSQLLFHLIQRLEPRETRKHGKLAAA